MQSSEVELNKEEIEIYNCIKNINNLKSFFLFAGAGSGKTHSLVKILQKYKKEHSIDLRNFNKKIAIITYTNAACEEIRTRLDYDDSFVVSTIHSFVWELIKPYQRDIKESLKMFLNHEIQQLEEKIHNAKNKNSKTCLGNIEKLENKKRRIQNIENIKVFSYEPNGINIGKDYLNHTEVISIGAEFIANKLLMQSILVQKYPILFIDESQDTNKNLMEAFFEVQKNNENRFSLGLFGDIMQRIYFDGKERLDENLPEGWCTPEKKYNFRSYSRIIDLANSIRNETDKRVQIAAKQDGTGFVNFFIIDTRKGNNKNEQEAMIRNKMAEITQDALWNDAKEVKTLILEHHMAANRGGFSNFLMPLYAIDEYRTRLLDGSLPEIDFLKKVLYDLIQAYKNNNKVKITQIVKKYSVLLSRDALKKCENQKENLNKVQNALDELFSILDTNNATLKDILENTKKNSLFELPDIFNIVLKSTSDEICEQNDELYAWQQALNCSISEFESYSDYISESSPFGTHQGVKGLEFDRVLAVIDDEESKGFMFKYEKLFGITPLTNTDVQNQSEGKETSVDRARRLFYVICTRAKQSLAVVAYTNQPGELKEQIMQKGWFAEKEIITI